MLNNSLQSATDTIIFDLEDSVAPGQKRAARAQLVEFLKVWHEADGLFSSARSLSMHAPADK